MLPEQQQRILGYFIEEARDHLNTIEQGLLNLESTLNDPEMINEVFRAAHSIKGGAAMLGLSSIQHTSHRLEDCFKVLKENPIQVDQKLESLFLGVSDTLKALLENLSGPFGLSAETANTLMSETEPVFTWLNEHLELLVEQGNSEVACNIPAIENHNTLTELFLQRDFSEVEDAAKKAAGEISSAQVFQHKEIKVNWDEFQIQVLQILREMLQQFKQNTTPVNRQNLQECCGQLVKLGEALSLPNWCSLCQATANAIANPQNTYLTLAKIVITEIKQAQELVLQDKDHEITISQQLETLFVVPEDDLLVDNQDTITSLSDLSQQLHSDAEAPLLLDSLSSDLNHPPSHKKAETKGPEVGITELNTLADLFEGETPELDETWQQEEILDISNLHNLSSNSRDSDAENADSDLADFLSLDEDANSREAENSSPAADLNLLFSDNFLEKGKPENLATSSAASFDLSNISKSDEIFREFSQDSHDTWHPPVEISASDVVENLLGLELDESQPISPDVVEDLLGLELDEPQILPTKEITQIPTDDDPSVELSVNQPNSFDELFLEIEKVDIPKKNKVSLDFSEQENLSLDNLFSELAADTLLSISESELGNLFDIQPPETTDNLDVADEQSQFWREEVVVETQQAIVDQDIAKELEESLFTAAADNDFFGDSQESTLSLDASFELEDFDLQISQGDVASLLDDEDDLFADLTPRNTTLSPVVSNDEVPLTAGRLLQSGNSSTKQTPENLDFLPEFTNQDTENDVNQDSEDIIVDDGTYIQLDINNDLITLEIPNNPEFSISEIDTVIAEELDLIDNLLVEESTDINSEILNHQEFSDSELDSVVDNIDEIDGLLMETTEPKNETENAVIFGEMAPENHPDFLSEFADLEALLAKEPQPKPKETTIQAEDFAALEALLGGENEQEIPAAPVYSPQFPPPANQGKVSRVVTSLDIDDEFSDLEKLLAEADQTISHSSTVKSNTNKIPRPSNRRAGRFEETMKVPVKQLDDMSNLVGELVVNRNTLEQDHERLRQSLDNLLIQVQQLSDVGARMQELYERSLLEASLLASRKNRDIAVSPSDLNTDRGFSELEMDRFTPFHTLSQEMIEMIVRVRESASDIDFVTEETERVARQFRQVTTQLQEGLTRARMVPFSQAIDRLRRGVRDNAIKCGKQVELVVEGENTLIDKMILDHLTDPLTHMLNNAIAHGIETPEIRQSGGKPPVGEITIRAFHQGNQTVISVGDDGAGIDPAKVKAKALKLGMISADTAKTMTHAEVYDLLFQSGFSIKDEADEISGRGVGMDVVRSEISEIRGTVNTDSAVGRGTTFTIRLPLTLSICKALCCVSDKARIAFPMDGVEDTLDIPLKNIQQTADGQSFIYWRDTTLPFRPLKEILAFNRHISRGNVYGGNRDDDMVSVVVVRSASNLIALQIDLVLSEQEIVIKQFEGPAPKPIGVAGATVLGDGRIMPIADVLEIMDIFLGRMSRQNNNSWQQKNTLTENPTVKIDPTVLIVDDSITVRELLSLTFNKAGYRVEQARDGQEAWDKLRSGLPCDIVFCDIEMPRCDGLELLSRIQKDVNLNHLPIAMLTSRGADKHRQMAIQLGASGYFTKPYLEEALLEAAVRMLKGEKLLSSTGG
ncbi:response regulator [Fortiea contorta]|uniref:hybrid sensor histidine kinase/response regulator n=1 Tax=Fortiea contorta TaxID=1892405 RepID=UPI0003456BE9|nr:response regulator [Fortiea contorta]